MAEFKLFLEGKWSSFSPGRQKEFGFMHEPGYNRKATSYLDQDTLDPEAEYDTDYNLYHVTTNLAGVRSSGRLKSRRELGVVGLGGGAANEAPGMVSTTYDYYRAAEIYQQIKFVAEMCRGQVKASTAFDAALGNFDRTWSEGPDEIDEVVRDFLPPRAFKKYLDGDESMLDKYIRSPAQIYELFQQIETAVSNDEMQSDDTYNLSAIGFTGSFQDMQKIDPSQVAIIQVVARKDARTQQVHLEKELRFWPQDLRIIRYYQP